MRATIAVVLSIRTRAFSMVNVDEVPKLSPS